MSNNAVKAYRDGKVPFSKLPAKIRALGRENVEQFVKPCEYHHTSSKYNCTDFWETAEVLSVFGIDESEAFPFKNNLLPTAVDFLAAFSKKMEKEGWKFEPGEFDVIDGDAVLTHPTSATRFANFKFEKMVFRSGEWKAISSNTL